VKQILLALLLLPAFAVAKSETSRIEIAYGKRPVVTLEGPESAGQFSIWSGPGTSTGPADGPREMPIGDKDFADWSDLVAEPPGGKAYVVRFYCAAQGENRAESVPSHQCYGVRYVPDPAGGGYIQIPPADDPEFRGNAVSIYRGVEGNWYRSTANWEEIVRPRIEAVLTAKQRDAYDRDYHRYRDYYRYRDYHRRDPYRTRDYSRPSAPRATGARPSMTPKKK
jgi:hypothetical protein